jgi:hypothetical protein
MASLGDVYGDDFAREMATKNYDYLKNKNYLRHHHPRQNK